MPQIPRVPAPVGNFGSFPPGGEGRFPSAGDIDIWWREPDAAEVFSLPDRRRTAFHIFGVDKGTTVWRSARVTIPQFPYDLPTMNFVKDPRNPLDGLGAVVAGKGGCCAHSVNMQDDLDFRPVNFGEISGDLRIGDGMELRTGRRLIAGEGYERSFLSNRTTFRKVENQYVDSVFVPNGVTQIAATGLTFRFEDTSAGGVSEAVRNGVSVFGEGGEPAPIHVEAPTDAQAYQPPQSFGIGLGPNAGITFDIAMLRERNPDFYLVNLIALEGMSRESARGASVQLRVLVDGVEIPFATNRFDVPGQSAPISVDLQTAERYVTLVSTSVSGPPGNGVFGLFQFRGFGKLANETLLPYTGPARPNLA